MWSKGLIGGLAMAWAGAAAAGEVAAGFEAIAQMEGKPPSEVLALPAVAAAVQAVVGADWPIYQAMLQNPGHGGLKGADYYGSACPDPDCEAGYGTLYVDPATGEVWVAWTDAGRLMFRPTDGSSDDGWPAKAQEAYEFWPEM